MFVCSFTGAGVMSPLENNNNMLSHGNSESGSDSNSPVQYSISPTQQGVSYLRTKLRIASLTIPLYGAI